MLDGSTQRKAAPARYTGSCACKRLVARHLTVTRQEILSAGYVDSTVR